MPLGIEVGLGVRDIVFDVDPATPRKKGLPTPTQFLAHVYCGQMAGCMKTPLVTEVDLCSGHIVLDGVPAPAKGAQHLLPLFGPCLLWARSPISATAELLYKRSPHNGSPYAIGLFCLSVLSVTLVYCGQTVGSIKMKYGTEVGLGLATLC